jgi:hypothetical protein
VKPQNAKGLATQLVARLAVSTLLAAAVVLPAAVVQESPDGVSTRQVEPVMYVDCSFWATLLWGCHPRTG